MSAPGTVFVPVGGVGGALPTDCDYRFEYHISIIGAGEDIKIDVTNCRGEPVYYVNPGQRVVLPKDTERGEIKPTPDFPQNSIVTDSNVILIIVNPEGASATYTLKNGVEPDVESVEMTTCGIDTNLVQETEIHIRGLEIRVTPEKRRISPGGKTNIEIKLTRVDDKGGKKPLPGKQIELDIRGLVDGDVQPSDDIITNDDGKAVLEFSAGENDKRVTFSAKFQPKKYEEFVHDETTVSVGRRSDATATLTARFREIYHYHNEDQDYTEDDQHRLSFDVTVEASFSYDKTNFSKNVSTYSQKYKLTWWKITKSSASLTGKMETVSKDKISTTITEATGNAEKDDSTRTLDIKFDAQTRKALEVNFPAFSVNIDGKGTVTSDSEVEDFVWRYYFRPIWGPFEEFIKVNSGDGIRDIGGKGIHVFKKQESFDRQTLSVDWNIELD